MKNILLLSLFLAVCTLVQAQCILLPNATAGITLVHQNTNCFNNSGVAFNPNLALYYGVRAGNSSFPLETWSAAGTPLFNTSAGFDWRGMWWNPTTNQLEGNGYNTSGIWKANLNGSGYAQNTGVSIFTGMNQPDAQSCGDLDWQAYEILYYSNGSIYRYSRTTNAFLGSYPITGTPVAISNLNSTTVMYTGCPGKEIALLDYNNKRVYVYNKANGAFAGSSQLPASAITTSSFRTSWANCHVWLFNVSNFTWSSYKIFDVCSACAPVYTNQSQTICSNDSIFVGGAWQNVSGIYSDTLTAANGCDSIIVNTLTVLPASITNQNQSICNGDSLFVGGAWQHTNGTYHDTLIAVSGCDSIITSTLIVFPILTSIQNLVICNGDSAFLGGAWQLNSGAYVDILTASTGCDSIVTTNLTILPLITSNRTLTICDGDSLMVGGAWQQTAGIYIDTMSSVAGCDSIVISTLIVHPVFLTPKTSSICEGERIFLSGQWQTNPGIYNDTLSAVTGCDSIISTTLIINPTPSVFLGKDTSLCQGQHLLLNATTLNATAYMWQDNSGNPVLDVTQSGTYWVEVSINSCRHRDSIEILFNEIPVVDLGPDISVCPDKIVTLDATAPNATYLWNDNTTKPTLLVATDGSFWVKVTAFQCSASDTIHIDHSKPDCPCSVYLPNAFSPNNDTKNDELRLLNSMGIELKDFRIYNRWGNEVFQTQYLYDSWNGNFKGAPSEIGIYYYVVRYLCTYNRKEYVLKGDITLLR